jgi:hypothetical protein
MIKELVLRFKTRSLVVSLLTAGAIALAIHDPAFRPTFGNIVSVGLGGYLGQLFPQKAD